MSGQSNEQYEQHTVEKTLWIFEYAYAGLSGGSLHLFYAANEQEAYTYVGEYIKRAAGRGDRLEFRHLQASARGFTTGYTAWLGTIHVRADNTVVEGSYRRPIQRVAYKGQDVEQGDTEDDLEEGG